MKYKTLSSSLLLATLLSTTSYAETYKWVISSTSIADSDVVNTETSSETDIIRQLQNDLVNQAQPAGIPLNSYFDTITKRPDLGYISHPQIAKKFFDKCKKLNGYTTVSFDKAGELKTELGCLTNDSSKKNAQWNYNTENEYGQKCAQFEGIVSIQAPYNNKYGPILKIGTSNTAVNNVQYQRYLCKIQFPTPIPAGKTIIDVADTSKFDTAKTICEQNKGTFVIDSYTVPGRSLFESRSSLYRFALCIFSKPGDIEAQISNSAWKYRREMNEYKVHLGAGNQYNPDNNRGLRCKNIFDKANLGADINYLGQAIPTGIQGQYTACEFSIKQNNNGVVFE